MFSQYFLSATIKLVQTWPDWNMSGIKHYIKEKKLDKSMHSFTNLMSVLASLELWINFKTYLKCTGQKLFKSNAGSCTCWLLWTLVTWVSSKYLTLLLHVKIVTFAFITDNIGEKYKLNSWKSLEKAAGDLLDNNFHTHKCTHQKRLYVKCIPRIQLRKEMWAWKVFWRQNAHNYYNTVLNIILLI